MVASLTCLALLAGAGCKDDEGGGGTPTCKSACNKLWNECIGNEGISGGGGASSGAENCVRDCEPLLHGTPEEQADQRELLSCMQRTSCDDMESCGVTLPSGF